MLHEVVVCLLVQLLNFLMRSHSAVRYSFRGKVPVAVLCCLFLDRGYVKASSVSISMTHDLLSRNFDLVSYYNHRAINHLYIFLYNQYSYYYINKHQ